jgi:integrase
MNARVPGFSYDGRRKIARFVLYVPGEKGKARRKKTFFGVTRDEALARYAAFREEVRSESDGECVLDRGVARERSHEALTLAAFIERYWERIAARVTARTARDYRYTIDSHLIPAFGATRLDRITSAAIQDFAADLKKKHYAAASINDYVNTLVILLHQAIDREEIDVFPLKRRIVREKAAKPKLELSPDEKANFVAAFDDVSGFREYLRRHRSSGKVVASTFYGGRPRTFGGGLRSDGPAAAVYFERFRSSKPVFVVALETGLRRSDLLNLRWSSVDFQGEWIRVMTQKTKEEVTIPISAACNQALLECRNRPIVSDRVFLEESGAPLSETRIRRHFVVAKEIAGITRRFRFHDLRHTFASTLSSKGVSLQVIAKVLGHSSVKMSERYARPNEEAMKSILTALDVTATL